MLELIKLGKEDQELFPQDDSEEEEGAEEKQVSDDEF